MRTSQQLTPIGMFYSAAHVLSAGVCNHTRRCLPTAARKTINPAPRVAKQLAAMSNSTSSRREVDSTGGGAGHVAADTTSRQAIKGQHIGPHKSPKTSGRALDAASSQKHGYAWSSTYASMHHKQQQLTAAQQPTQPMRAATAAAFKAGSRVVRSAASNDMLNATSQTAATLPPAMPAAAPLEGTAASAMQQPYGYSGGSSTSSSLNGRRSSTGDTTYTIMPCYRHLGPTSMQPPAASADHSITCLGSGSTTEGGSSQAGGSDVLGVITSLLSDLYKIGFSSSSSSGSSNGQELEGRSSSMSKKQAAAAAVAAATDSLRNLPI